MLRSILPTALLLLTAKAALSQFVVNTGIPVNNSALITCNGAWTNSQATRITNNGVISTSESFVNSGVFDNASTGAFHLDFATDLNFQAGSGVASFGTLTKEGAGVALVSGTIGIKDTMSLNNGLLRLVSATDTVILYAGAVLASGESSYVDNGLVARAGIGDMVFPLGKDGLYLPLKIYKLNAAKAVASVTDAPLTHTAGPGVDALIGFPYAWHVKSNHQTDTAGYIEVNYPAALPSVVNPIIVREIPGQEYASMGARLIENNGARITVKSYSRRLRGTFTVAQGFPSDPVTDSLALVALWQSTDGLHWTDTTKWLRGDLPTWAGITVEGQSITRVELPNNNLAGPVPDQLVDILSLQVVNLSGNRITAIPDFTLNPEVSSLNVSDNNLDFASLEPNASVTGINYLIQEDIAIPADSLIPVGTMYSLTVPAGGSSSEYKWRRNGEVVADATHGTLIIPSIGRETMGEYVAEITNPKVPGLVLRSTPQQVIAYAQVAGKLLVDVDLPAEQGEVTLYKVQPGAFEPVSTTSVNADGSFTFEKTVLADYQIRGFADTLRYEGALPTYYVNTILWEEADTILLAENISGMNIVSQFEPGPPSGHGSISGYLQEDDGTGRNMDPERNKRVARAGVSARRVQRTGRTQGVTLILVAYVFTDENGEFTLPNLPTGEYRLNFQYPGYPMDESSYTTIFIGDALESQVQVEANVIGGKINVRKLIITGLYESAGYRAEVFPNPAVEHIRLQFGGEVNSRTITIHNTQGQVITTLPAASKEMLVDVSRLEKGIYILHIAEAGRKVKTLKLSIEE